MGTHCYGITLITSHETWLVHTSVYQFTMPNAKKTSQNVIQCLSETTAIQRQMLILFRRIKKCPSSSLSSKCHDLIVIFTGCPISIQVVQLDTLLLRADGRKTIISFEFCNREREKQVSPCAKCANFFFLSCFAFA